MKNKNIYKLLWVGTIGIERRLKLYKKLLNSKQYFSKKEYKYFGGRIFDLRLLRIQISDELVRRFFNLFK